MQLGVRELARAEARAESGMSPGPTAIDGLANIDTMTLVEEAAEVEEFGESEILAIHRRLLVHAPNRRIARQFRSPQNWISGNDYNWCGAYFVPPPPEDVCRYVGWRKVLALQPDRSAKRWR